MTVIGSLKLPQQYTHKLYLTGPVLFQLLGLMTVIDEILWVILV